MDHSPRHTPEGVARLLAGEGYSARRAECLALAGAAAAGAAGHTQALLLEGPPGAGKTALAAAWAAATGARLVYALLHSWSDDQELCSGVDVAAAVAGDAERVRQDGVLAVAARASLSGPVVLCLDEVDKAPERVEGLLLDWLQSGRVPVGPGQQLQAELPNLLVIVTSNGQRPLGDALLRRCRRVRMQPLPAEQVERLVATATGAPAGVISVARKLASEIAEADGTTSSVQEITSLVRDLLGVAESAADARELLGQHAARGAAGAARAAAAQVGPLWAEVQRARRGAP